MIGKEGGQTGNYMPQKVLSWTQTRDVAVQHFYFSYCMLLSDGNLMNTLIQTWHERPLFFSHLVHPSKREHLI